MAGSPERQAARPSNSSSGGRPDGGEELEEALELRGIELAAVTTERGEEGALDAVGVGEGSHRLPRSRLCVRLLPA
jgi:hypothetical protein